MEINENNKQLINHLFAISDIWRQHGKKCNYHQCHNCLFQILGHCILNLICDFINIRQFNFRTKKNDKQNNSLSDNGLIVE